MITPSWIEGEFKDLSCVAPIGHDGGQKSVFSCLHSIDGDVVLKIIHPHTSQDLVDREVQAVSHVQSNRVPTIFETGTVVTPIGDRFWIREQRILGETLREKLSKGPIAPGEAIKLATHMLEALTAAEAKDIVHRDVKPENIMIDGNGDFWLLDFGIARHLTMASLTSDFSTFGKFTAGYAPLEQVRNYKDDIDSRADLFGLGVTLYESVTGVNPHIEGAADVLEVIRRTETTHLPRLTTGLKAADSFADFVETLTKIRLDQRCATVVDAVAWMQDISEKEANG